jgi:hypothetical protein
MPLLNAVLKALSDSWPSDRRMTEMASPVHASLSPASSMRQRVVLHANCNKSTAEARFSRDRHILSAVVLPRRLASLVIGTWLWSQFTGGRQQCSIVHGFSE